MYSHHNFLNAPMGHLLSSWKSLPQEVPQGPLGGKEEGGGRWGWLGRGIALGLDLAAVEGRPQLRERGWRLP